MARVSKYKGIPMMLELPVLFQLMQARGDTLSSLRSNKVISRAVTDQISEAQRANRLQVHSTDTVIFSLANHFGCMETSLASPGAFAEAALRFPEQIPAKHLYSGDNATELVAMPVGAYKAQQIATLAKQSDKPLNFCPNYPPDGHPKECELVDAEREFCKHNPNLVPDTIEWVNAWGDGGVRKTSVQLEKIDEYVTKQDFIADPHLFSGKNSMGALIAESRKAEAAKQQVKPDLSYPEEGFRIFYCYAYRFATPEIRHVSIKEEWVDVEGEEYPRRADEHTQLAHYKFLSEICVAQHMFVIGPVDAPFVFLRGLPEKGVLQLPIYTGDVPYMGMNDDGVVDDAVKDWTSDGKPVWDLGPLMRKVEAIKAGNQ